MKMVMGKIKKQAMKNVVENTVKNTVVMKRVITEQTVEAFKTWLICSDKGVATVQKYVRDLKKLVYFADGKPIDRKKVIEYKRELWNCGKYKIRSINSFLVAANRFFKFMGWYENVIETYPVQEELFRSDEKVLTKEECQKMVDTAEREGKTQLSMIIQVLCNTGIRVSELKFITAEAVRKGEADILNKGKVRTILLSDNIQKRLLEFMKKKGIEIGSLFLSSRGNPVDRSNLSKQLKAIAKKAEVDSKKVYVHNFRYQFAQCFYQICKDVVKVAALLGHSHIKTTLHYLKTTKQECRDMLNQMKIVCNRIL